MVVFVLLIYLMLFPHPIQSDAELTRTHLMHTGIHFDFVQVWIMFYPVCLSFPQTHCIYSHANEPQVLLPEF